MNETMDTSEVAGVSDETDRNEETSPILSRRHIQRTPRAGAITTGWITALSSRSQRTAAARSVPSTSHFNLVETDVSFNQDDSIPPPIEDTDLIMIHRPDEVNVTAQSSPNVTHDPAAETSNSNPGTSNAANTSEPILVELDQSHEDHNVIEIQDQDEHQDSGRDSVEESSRDGLEDRVATVPSSTGPDVENLPLAQRIQSPELILPEGSSERNPTNMNPSEGNSPERTTPQRISPEGTPPARISAERTPSLSSPVAASPRRLELERSPPDRGAQERSPPAKKAKVEAGDDSDEEEEGKLCPICFDAWTNSGDHRLVSLRCGHLFGQHCIKHWLEIHKASDRKCPQCKKKATVKDIRALYASKIRVLDTSEQEALKETIKKLEEEKELLSRELAHERKLHQDAIKIQQEQQLKLQQLQNQGLFPHSIQQSSGSTTKVVAAIAAQIKIQQTNRVEVSRDGGCRVLAYNEWKNILVASQQSITPLFPDFGIRLIDTEEFRLRQLMPMHSKAIRDLSFNPHRKDLLLTASLDKTAKMFCMSSNASVMSFNAEVPLWSCCWDGNNSNVFFAGSHNGITFQYDIRNTHTEVSRVVTQGDGTPVISIAAIPAGAWLPNGGFLSCRLNRLRVYERTSNSEFRAYPLDIEGPFTALNYNHKTNHMLITTRPTGQNPHVKHQLYEMGFAGAQPRANIVHSFDGSTTQRVMSRPCQLEIDGSVKDTLICAHQESESYVSIWSVRSGQKIPAGPLHSSEHVLDLCPLKVNNRTYLASLSEKTLRVYQFS
ncbi:E3 ubiquitin-protein ligase RFWD3 [Frankliniella fusca]|uniref:RING-type E3 ubiquitin transferase n=1 Tax=Frankliniella fusca TaxID=407009 RepID=A0AAE1HHE2_9NEOP|nr:E3 ubiquitin-protein ligase RFWD3 [Frankliniella fusca]